MTAVQDLGERIIFDLGHGDEAVATTGDAIAVLSRLKGRYSERLYFHAALASMEAASRSGTDVAIRAAVNDYKMFLYNTF